MDEAILAKNGVKISNPRKAFLNDYTLKIGNRASLVPCKNERAYGVLMTADEKHIRRLYSEASVVDYIPEEVVVTYENELIGAFCYNLPEESLTGTNKAYAQSLLVLAKKLGFPEAYLKQIK